MIFNFDKKEYDTETLSDQGKLYVEKLQTIAMNKNQLSLQFTDLEILQKHYSELLRKELPKEEIKKNKHLVDEKEVGVIAQDVEAVLPELVATREDGSKAVRYERLCAVLIESIKELKKEIQELKTGA